ncbi:siroheme synthase CysG [Telmatobacter bradus]|uniref:siroheme synthase CysG n=1 Tax=Telmatobacter bradus TaxID=474953 RepID=UPI003B42E2F8
MSLLPVFLKIEGARVLLVGAGSVALEKAGSLLRAGARLRVVAPGVREEFRLLAAEGRIELMERGFAPGDLDDSMIVVVATNDPATNARIRVLANQKNILANSVDDPPNCDFFFSSVVARGDLQVAISTAGKSPALGQRLKREIDAQLPADLGAWLDEIGTVRQQILATDPPGAERKARLHRLVEERPVLLGQTPSEKLGAQPERLAAGKVSLVGAGPGDPDLLTVKALRRIEQADVILHDDLVSAAILKLAGRAERINVGKRCGSKAISQEQIHRLMIEQAQMGRSVVRLKGGDPMLFGRAAEEMAALEAAGVPYEVVPGISAVFAAAAAAGCSLTDRKSASQVLIATGHLAQPEDPNPPAQATRVVYMPGRDARPLAGEWLAAGLPADLPCVLVARASQPDQQVIHTTLGALSRQNELLPAPSLLLAGWALRPKSVTREEESQLTAF